MKETTKAISGSWYECRVKIGRMQPDGVIKVANEIYVMDALSFTEAEARVINEVQPFTSGIFDVAAIKKCNYAEVIYDTDEVKDDRWYAAKVAFISIDEKSGKEKRSIKNYLVRGCSVQKAQDNLHDVMGSTMNDYEISGTTETKVLDVFLHSRE